jgi:hypothetical protein
VRADNNQIDFLLFHHYRDHRPNISVIDFARNPAICRSTCPRMCSDAEPRSPTGIQSNASVGIRSERHKLRAKMSCHGYGIGQSCCRRWRKFGRKKELACTLGLQGAHRPGFQTTSQKCAKLNRPHAARRFINHGLGI